MIPKKIFDSIVDKELEFDSALPEYCPDIARLIRVDCSPHIDGCEAGAEKVHINGRAVYDILYETDYKNKLRCCSFTQEFTHSVNLPKHEHTSLSAFADIKCDKISCKLLSPRKFVIKARLGAKVVAEGESAVKAVAVTDDADIFFKKNTIGFDGRTETFREDYRFSESIPLAQSEKNIGEVVYGTVDIQPPQTTVSPGLAELKSSATVHVLYEDEANEGTYVMSTKSVPVAIRFSNPAIEDYKRIDISLEPSDTEITAELDQYGESRIIKVAFTVQLTMRLCEPKAYTVAADLFSPGFEDTLTEAKTTLPHLHSTADRSFTIELKVPPFDPPVFDLYHVTANDFGSTAEKTDGGINASGTLSITVLGNTPNGVHSFDHSVPYEQFLPIELPDESSAVVVDIYPFDILPTLHSDGSISARVICGAKIHVFAEETAAFISDIAKRREISGGDNGYNIIYCFPSRDDNLWSIAKQYYVNPETIRSSNPSAFDESGNTLTKNKPVVIKK